MDKTQQAPVAQGQAAKSTLPAWMPYAVGGIGIAIIIGILLTAKGND